MVTITVININGIKTIIHETMLNPDLHKRCNINPTVTVTTNFIIAVLKSPLNKSNMICVNEKIIYINAGGQISIPSMIFI
jgi:hypothetical protein